MAEPLVSIIIPCYNGGNLIADAIESALRQTYAHREVIVVDDGSTDNSLDVIRSFGDRLRWETGPNRGGSAARNRGLKLARGKLIQFLDADDMLNPRKLELQVPRVVETGADTYCDWRDVLPSGETLRTVSFPQPGHQDVVEFILDAHLITGSCVHRRKWLDKIGGFREDLPCAQERDMHLRLACAGTSFRRVPEVLMTRRLLPGSVSSNYVKVLKQHGLIMRSAYEILQQAGRLTDLRARVFASFMAHDARYLLQRGQKDLALHYLEVAASMHPEAGLDRMYVHRLPRTCYRLFGFLATERLIRLKRTLFGQAIGAEWPPP